MVLRRQSARGGRFASATSAAIITACLAGCGGGGDGGGPREVVVPQGTRSVAASAGSDVSAANWDSLGGWLARAVLSASGDSAFGIAGTSESPQARSPGAALRAPLHARVLQAALRRSEPMLGAREQAAAVTTEVLTCENGGSTLVTVNDADNNNKLSAGDAVTLVATNCVLEAGIPATSGTLRLTINAVELTANGEPTALDASATVTNFSVGSYGRYNGAMRLWNKPEGSGDRTRVSFMGTRVAYAGTEVVFDFDIYGLSGNESRFELDGGMGIGGQTYSIVSTAAMTAAGSNPPASGALQLRDAAGDAVRLTARSAATLDLDFVPAGATNPAASMAGLPWADYLILPQ